MQYFTHPYISLSRIQSVFKGALLLVFLICILGMFSPLASARSGSDQTPASSQLERLTSKIDLQAVFPGAVRMGAAEGTPKAAPVFGPADASIGYVFVNTDYVPSIGYSGKPIHVAIGVDLAGEIQGASLLEHSEPIVLVGIPNYKIKAFIDAYKGLDAVTISRDETVALPADIVSGATVTVIVIDASIKRSVVLFAQSRGIGGLEAKERVRDHLRDGITKTSSWDTLFGEGAIRHMLLTNADVNQAFADEEDSKAAARPEKGADTDTFIDLYTATVSQPSIGLTLLGAREYKNLANRLDADQHAVLIMANGHYSYRGSGFVRGGIFDRFQLVQGDKSWLFRDKQYKNLGTVADGPDFKEVGLFLLPDDGAFDPTAPWRLQLLIQRAVGAIQKSFITRSLNYQLPARFIEKAPAAVAAPANTAAANEALEINPIVEAIWKSKKLEIIITIFMILVLTAIFYGQLWLAARPRLLKTVRASFLIFSLFWLGFYANAQLSVVNVLTFAKAFVGNFNWDYFLLDPLLFILWGAVAAGMILWGRGVFCGWLCPFGALQELLSMIAKKLHIPQVRVPWALHELLLSVKYIIFIGLFGLSLYSMGLAEHVAEIEPFKTVIILKFAREWPFVIYALLLLSAGLFIERFYCRYLCPLGAALAIPARLRTNDWMKRYFMCGNPCQRCANECMVQAIRPDGQIHPNECINCMHCQELYTCSTRCPVMIEKQKRRDKRLKNPTPTMGPKQILSQKTK